MANDKTLKPVFIKFKANGQMMAGYEKEPKEYVNLKKINSDGDIDKFLMENDSAVIPIITI